MDTTSRVPHERVPLFTVILILYILKLIRNHTLDSVMEVMIDGRKTTVSKEDLVKLTNLDAPAYEIRACHKLGKPSKKRIFYDI